MAQGGTTPGLVSYLLSGSEHEACTQSLPIACKNPQKSKYNW